LIGLPEAGFTDRALPARATCSRDEGSFPALLALATSGSGTLRIEGANVNLPRTGIVANSTDPGALQLSDGGSVTAKYIETGSGAPVTTALVPPPSTGTYANPYAGVTEPTPAGSSGSPPACPLGSTPSMTPGPRCIVNGGIANPGLYWGGLRLRGNVTLNPGTYHIAGGDLSIEPGIGPRVINGAGVTLYIGPDETGNCGNPSHNVHVEDNFQLLITPPTGGDLRDLIIFRSPGCSGSGVVEFHPGVTIGAPGPPYGAVYAPSARVDIGDGTSSVSSVNAIVVASRIRVSGAATFADIFIPSGDVRHGDIHLVE
jgi:hypothetical protein